MTIWNCSSKARSSGGRQLRTETGEQRIVIAQDCIQHYIIEESLIETTKKEPPEQGELREVSAPPGKLGIVVDKSKAIVGIYEWSPLRTQVLVGDKIVSINNVDTRKKNGAYVLLLLKATKDVERKIVVVKESKEETEAEELDLENSLSMAFV